MMNLKPGMLNGVLYKEIMKLKYDETEFEIEIKAMTHNQSTQIQAIMQQGIEITNGFKPLEDFSNVKLDTEKNLEASNRALLLSCEYGTVNPEWNQFNIDAEWPSEWVKEVGNRVMIISGIGDAKAVEQFRTQRGGIK